MLAAIHAPFGLGDLAALEGPLLYGKGAADPFGPKTGKFPTRDTRGALGADCEALDDLMVRVAAARPRRLALAVAERSWLMNRFARAFLDIYASRKEARGWLDFDDLILGARDLLRHAAVAEWVLFRLDGGIDHILVDEAQDTSPTQWQVIEALAREFAAGRGARDRRRTLFVVGDKKQSIYSFQGADPEGFDRMHAHFAARIGPESLARLDLEHSFRSAPAVLAAVDATFAGRMGGVAHRAFRDHLPGRVDLWPLVEPQEDGEDAPWFDPVDRRSPEDADLRLARDLADWICGLIDAGETIPYFDKNAGEWRRRPVHAGDFLILVRRRGGIFHPIIRACKARGLDIAGADVLTLEDDLAVTDLLSLLRFLALPEDDLSLAEALRSPLFGLSEDDLYRLAHGRGARYLWQVLRAGDAHPEARAMIGDLLDQADFLRPYELLDRILLRHRGRERLIGRLGLECIDAIDALLAQALAYERSEVASLTGFLAWFAADRVTVKRQADGAGRRLRVMTVHGAKGLEAPIVILPDTVLTPPRDRDGLLPLPEGPVLWRPNRDDRPPSLDGVQGQRDAAEAAERDRLLYVAMTRAQYWLIVCGAARRQAAAQSWHAQVTEGLDRLATEPLATPAGEGRRHAVNDWRALIAPLRPLDDAAPAHDLPRWIDGPAPPAPEPAPILTPSELGGAKVVAQGAPDAPAPGDADAEMEAEAAKARGTRIHLLLEHLPAGQPGDWPALARHLLAAEALPDPEIAALLDEAARVLTDPALAALLARPALAEVDLVARHPGGGRLHGTIDRLIVEPGRVLAIDYKSNRVVPESAEAIPEGLLRQMGAYDHALAQIYPGRTIETALLWTRAPRLMPVPADEARRAFARSLA